MRKIVIEDLSDVAYIMYKKVQEDECIDTTFVGFYEDAVAVIKNLLMYDDVNIFNIDLTSEMIDGYDREFYVSLDDEMNIWCSKAYDVEDERYIYSETDCLLIADDCKSTILKYIGYDEANAYEVSYDLDDETCECDGNCACCDLSDNNQESITRIATDDDGKMRGFEKTWTTKSDGINYHTTYSFYSNNESMLKDMLDNFDIKF